MRSSILHRAKSGMITFVIFASALFFNENISHAQPQAPFQDEIYAFKKKDSAQFPPKHAILFVGSSSFNMWKDVQDYFPGYKIINRGFGGSSLPDVIRFADDIIFPYQPKEVVIYCGENDLAGSDTVTSNTVFNRFRELFELIRKKMPNERIVFVSIKPSPSRQHLMPKMKEANHLISQFLTKKPNTIFVDVYSKMLDAQGLPRKELFIEDQLHMNKLGYTIWQKEIVPYLLK